MTNEFRELTDRLAKALNFDDGTVCLITSTGDNPEVHVVIKGDVRDLTIGICSALEQVFEASTDHEARMFREEIKQVIVKDEEQRFQTIEEETI